MNQSKLDKVLKLHKLWIEGDSEGKKADLSGDNLEGANLLNANLKGANTKYATINFNPDEYEQAKQWAEGLK